MQPVGTQSDARRATAGLTVVNARERNNADGRVPAGPKGARQTGQIGVAVLGKGTRHSLRTAPCLGRFGGLCILNYHLDGVLGPDKACFMDTPMTNEFS